jgi:PPP family 3-phenylpropionic acid transporter
LLFWRLSAVYFFYFAVLGVLVPYFGLYLKSIGFSPVEIGHLMAVLMVSRIVAPNVWAWIADHREQRLTVIRLSSFAAAVCFLGMFAGTGFWWLAFVLLAFSFFWHASLPVLEVFTLNHTGRRPGAYGRVRLWGSIGFIVAVMAVGPVLDTHGPWWVLPLLAVLLGAIFVATWLLHEARPTAAAGGMHPEPFLKTILKPPILAFLLVCLLMQVSHGPYYTFYSIYLEGYGYAKTLIGALWAFGVVCEIGVFLAMPRLLARFGLREVLLASFAAAVVRWILIGVFPESLVLLTLAQALHAATFGSFHAAAMQMVYRFFTGRHQHRGQAVYSTVGFGIGGVIGSLYSGHTWEALGPGPSFAIAAAAAAGAFVIGYTRLSIRT